MEEFDCLFWNLNLKYDNISNWLASNSKPHLLFLAECGQPESFDIENYTLIEQLDSKVGEKNYSLSIHFLNEGGIIKKEFDVVGKEFINNYRSIALLFRDQYLFFLVHLPSMMTVDRDGALAYCVAINEVIRNIEDDNNIRQTIVVGDFNLNPFDSGMISPIGFNAPYSYETVRPAQTDELYQESMSNHSIRSIRFRFPYFYNPMWQKLGEANAGDEIQGTFIRKKSNKTDDIEEGASFSNDIWERRHNILDQVLVRPALMTKLKSVKILKTDHITQINSDHRPLLFTIEL